MLSDDAPQEANGNSQHTNGAEEHQNVGVIQKNEMQQSKQDASSVEHIVNGSDVQREEISVDDEKEEHDDYKEVDSAGADVKAEDDPSKKKKKNILNTQNRPSYGSFRPHEIITDHQHVFLSRQNGDLTSECYETTKTAKVLTFADEGGEKLFETVFTDKLHYTSRTSRQEIVDMEDRVLNTRKCCVLS